jgi:hypothetical protein
MWCKLLNVNQKVSFSEYLVCAFQNKFNIFLAFFLYFNPYTMHVHSVCTIRQQMHNSDSLFVTLYSSYIFYICTSSSGSLLLCVLLGYIKDACSLSYM